MDPHSFIARAEAQRWLGIAEKLLTGHDLIGAKTFAIRARESDPRLEGADQILAIADTLLAAEKQVVGSNGTQQPDYYAILQLVRFVQDTEHIVDQYRRLAVTLNPHQNRFPYSDQAFQLVNDAWTVLSNPLRKSMYDQELDFPQQQEMNHVGFNLEQHHNQQQQQQHHHQQQQHNFFSVNRVGSGHEQELVEQQQTFQTRVQRSHQQHNFLSQPNPVRPSPVREQEHLFQQLEQEELFHPQVQPFQITSTPQQQSRPPTQPPQPQPPMRSPTPPVTSPQPPLSWPQAPPHSQWQPPTRSTTPPSPPPAASPQPPASWPQPPPYSQPQPGIRSRTPPPPPAAPPQPSVSWQQAPPHSQPQPAYQQPESQPQPAHQQPESQPQQHQHLQPPPLPKLDTQRQPELQQEQQHQRQESPEQNATTVHSPTVDTNNVVSEEERESVTEADSENVDASPTFWTACPYCLYMYEYPRVYAECTLRCTNCERAFQAVPIPSPPPIIEDQEAYFCCWGSFPLGISISHLENNNIKVTNRNWTSISPLCDVSSQIHQPLNSTPAKQNRNWGPRIYKDDDTDDIFTGISEPSDDSDLDWNGNKNTKVKKKKKRGRKRKAKLVDVETRKKTDTNLPNSTESSKNPLVSNPRRQSGRRVAKEMGKLDLNVEFNNNEGEEANSKNRGHGQGEEDNIEGNGFFEGLDEFLNSLPILSVVNEEKVKAS